MELPVVSEQEGPHESEEVCGNCKYYEQVVDDGMTKFGECRIRPPVVNGEQNRETGGAVLNGVWPCVLASDWCGDFKAAEVPF